MLMKKMEEELFDWVDYIVFGVLLLISAMVGVYFAFFASKKQDNVNEYLMGGRTMGVFPISMSLIASYISGISLLGIPAEMYVYGTQYWLVVFSEAMVSVTMTFVYIPVFYTLQITSSYEYLRLRFNKKVRTLGTLLFLIKMLLYIPLVVYVPALAFSQVSGINLHLVTPIVCVVCIFYTCLGGLKAVVWADTIQMIVMVGAMVTVIVLGVCKLGLSTIFERNNASGRIEFDDFRIDPRIRHTGWGMLIGNYFYWLAACSVNQAMVQRCLSMPTRRKADMTILILALGIVVLVSMCCFTGLIVYAFFDGCDPITTKEISKPDQVLPYFVMKIGGAIPGFPGVFVSGVFSAALSTMSTGLNSMTGVIYEDLIRPCLKRPLSESVASLVMKIMVVFIGAVCVGLVFVVEKLGALIQVGKSLAGITAGPLLGLFSLGMFFPWANSHGALLGGVSGVTLTACLSILTQTAIAQGNIRFPKKPVSVDLCDNPAFRNISLVSEPIIKKVEVPWVLQLSYMWYVLIGMTTVIVVGMLVSFVTGFNEPRKMDKDLFTPVIHRFLPEKHKITDRGEERTAENRF